MISEWSLTICSAAWYLSSALRQHCGPLDTSSESHGWSLSHHLLLFLAKNAGQYLPVSRSGPSVRPNSYV